MPVLYFIITPTGSRHSCTVWGKFGHCLNVEQRIRSYSLPSKKYASVEYDYKASMERPMDNIINRITLRKGSQSPLVNFMQSDRSNAKIDWFEISGAAAYSILDVVQKLNAIKSQEHFDCFTADLLVIIATYNFRRSLVPLQYKSDHYMFILEHDQFMINIDKGGMEFFEKECCSVVGTNTLTTKTIGHGYNMIFKMCDELSDCKSGVLSDGAPVHLLTSGHWFVFGDKYEILNKIEPQKPSETIVSFIKTSRMIMEADNF